MRRCLCVAVLFVLITTVGVYLFIFRDLPSVAELKAGRPPVTYVYASDGRTIGQFSSMPGRYVSIKRIPRHLIEAVIATEDSRFFKHHGLDYMGILRAAIKDLIAFRLKEGGSTITQQLAKMLYLSNEKTIIRKLKEAVLAIKIERALTKTEILELYLNRAYFGAGAYGVEDAARLYFGKSVSELNLKEAALLAGLLKAPNLYSPFKDIKRAEQRAQVVLKRMEQEGFLKPSQRKEASAIKLKYNSGGMDKNYGYFLDIVREYLEQKYGVHMTYKGGLRVYTTLDIELQSRASRALKNALHRMEVMKRWRGPLRHAKIKNIQYELKRLLDGRRLTPFIGEFLEATVLRVYHDRAILKVKGAYAVLKRSDARWAFSGVNNRGSLKSLLRPADVIMVKVEKIKGPVAYVSLQQLPEVQGAVVVLDPASGYVLALVGGYDYRLSQFNRATQAKRQIGSLFKPFVYALALQKGLTPATVVVDEPVRLTKGDGTYWSPRNYDGRYRGRVNLRYSLVNSLNVPTVKIARFIGLPRLTEFAQSLGFKSLPHDLTLALGSLVATPLEVAKAYTIFANYGRMVEPIFIKKIITPEGKYLEVAAVRQKRLISEAVAYVVTDILREAVQKGTARAAAVDGADVAGKTGTTDEFRDAWFAGYSPDMIAVVWIGYDDGGSLGRGYSGGRIAAPVWKELFTSVKDRFGKRRFYKPDTVVSRLVDRNTGLRVFLPGRDTYRELFIKGKEPDFKIFKTLKDLFRE